MSVNSVSRNSAQWQNIQPQQASVFKQRKQEFDDLGKALSAGAIAGAQNALRRYRRICSQSGKARAPNRPARQTCRMLSPRSVKLSTQATSPAPRTRLRLCSRMSKPCVRPTIFIMDMVIRPPTPNLTAAPL